MKKSFLLIALFISSFSYSQYCAFFDFKTDEPEMVVSSLKGMMQTEWAKNIQGTKSLFAYQFNGTNQATHTLQFCFPDEAAFASFSSSWNSSLVAQVFGEKLNKHIEPTNQALNTPVWFQNDWAPDQVFFIYQMEVSNPTLFVKEFAEFSQSWAKKNGITSYGVGFPISGKNADYSHFVWTGAPDVETALSTTKKMFSDPLFAKYSTKVDGIRKLVNTTMMVRLMDF
jgi:hypothetical protein